MKLSSYLDPALIFVNIEAQTKDEAITTLIERAAVVDPVFAQLKPAITTAVLEREHGVSTAIGHGIAVPHARVEGYNDVIVVIGVLQRAIQCELATKEQGEMQVIFLVVVGKTRNQLMLQLMAGLMKLAEHRDVFSNILRKPDPEDIYAQVRKAGIQLKKDFLAGDLMNTELQPARLDNTLDSTSRSPLKSLHTSKNFLAFS